MKKHLLGKGIALLALSILAWMLLCRLGFFAIACIWALAIGYVLLPLQKRLEKAMPGGRAALCTLMIAMLVLIGVPLFMIPVFAADLREIAAQIPQLTDSIRTELRGCVDWINHTAGLSLEYGLIDQLQQWVLKLLRDFSQETAVSLTRNLNPAGILIPFFVFYFLRDRQQLMHGMLYLIPVAYRGHVLAAASGINRVLHRYVHGQLLIATLVGILTALGLWLIGVRYWPLLGALAGILNVIPYVGGILAMIPLTLVSILGGWSQVIRTILVVLCVQQIESLLLSPRIMSVSLDLHPALVLSAVIVGGTLGGVFGFLFALPTLIVIRGVFRYLSLRMGEKKRPLHDCIGQEDDV